jgi:tetratricopeptide (TPR) repeat protein
LKNKDFVKENNENIKALFECMKSNKKDFRYYAASSDFFISLKEYDKAILFIDSALYLKKDNYLIWEQAILITNYLKNYNEVINKVNECTSIFPDKINLLIIKAYAEHALAIDDSALVTANKIIVTTKEKDLKIEALNLMAEIYRGNKNYIKSDECFNEILLLDKENLLIRNNYSYYLAIRGECLSKALDLSKLTIEKDPNNATYLDTYGWILFKMGKEKEAKSYIESAIRYGAYNNPEVLDHYGEIMLKMGRCKDAIEAWERVVEVDSSYSIINKLTDAKNNCK